MEEKLRVNIDAWSHGQVTSKLWLCKTLENLMYMPREKNIWIYGGWCGITAFLLFARENMNIRKIYSFDFDLNCEEIADMINNNWVVQDLRFKAFTENVNSNLLIQFPVKDHPDIIINTSCEHMLKNRWFEKIEPDKIVALQSNNLNHDGASNIVQSLEEMKEKYSLSDILFEGEKEFNYPDKNFKRFMIIGIK